MLSQSQRAAILEMHAQKQSSRVIARMLKVSRWSVREVLRLGTTALRMALSRRSIQPGLVHHSDRGSQYASNDYTGLLKAHGIDISMSRKGNPWDNAACESFMKTLKYEEVRRWHHRQ